MTKAELRKSHDAMARYLRYLCRFSDTRHNGRRSETVERHYQRARRLLKRAGHEYRDPFSAGKRDE